jgi:hypothetical protein
LAESILSSCAGKASGNASTGDIARAQGNDLGLRYAGETEHHLGKQASEQKKPDQVPIFEQKD